MQTQEYHIYVDNLKINQYISVFIGTGLVWVKSFEGLRRGSLVKKKTKHTDVIIFLRPPMKFQRATVGIVINCTAGSPLRKQFLCRCKVFYPQKQTPSKIRVPNLN
jgi:hypothetical protein